MLRRIKRIKMFDREDQRLLWVSSEVNDNGDGTYDKPFSTVENALKIVEPGNTIILKSGIYEEDVTIQVSGKIDKPIRITIDDNAIVELTGVCWFFYDTSDLIVSGLTFKNAPYGAISVIGACQRNRFDNLQFINCGTADKESCTMYFGGSSAECNVVESCMFICSKDKKNTASNNAIVGLMVSEGDNENGMPIKHHIFRKNRFENYTHGILIGSNNDNASMYGHIVEYNTVLNCSVNGILVKCGDTQVRGNLIKNCSSNAIVVAAGSSSVIEDNRIESCSNGIAINGSGHNVANNCIINCKNQAILVAGSNDGEKVAATNLFIEKNTCIDCGIVSEKEAISGILIEPGTTCIVNKNLVYGKGLPYFIIDGLSEQIISGASKVSQHVITDNALSGINQSLAGFSLIDVDFPNYAEGNFENNSGFGAQGWMLKPEGYDPNLDNITGDTDYLDTSFIEDEEGNITIASDIDQQELFSQYFSDVNEGEEPNYSDDDRWDD